MGVDGIPYGFCDVWRQLKTLSKPIKSKNKRHNPKLMLGALPSLNGNQRKILNEIYKNSKCDTYQIITFNKDAFIGFFGNKTFALTSS